VYLAQLNILNFRKLKKADLSFQRGVNILVGANNVGKTAVVGAQRALLAELGLAFLACGFQEAGLAVTEPT
jgi:putative ATP-dependent endonuclease of the OLD family